MGTPYTVVRQTSIAASAARIFPCIEDFRAWRAWSPWRQLDPGIQEEYSDPSFGVGARYKWSENSAGTLSTACAIGVDPSPKRMTLPMLAGSARTAAVTAATSRGRRRGCRLGHSGVARPFFRSAPPA